MDSRSAAHALSEIAGLLELRSANRFKSRAYRTAARAVLALDTDDIGPLYHSGELAKVPGIGPATLRVLADLIEQGDSRYLDQLRENTPAGVLEMMRIPGLGPTKIQVIYESLGVETVQELEEAATDGRLASLPRFGPKTAAKILKGIAFMKETGALMLYPHAEAEASRLLATVRRHPDVIAADVAGSLRRRREVIGDIDIVAAVRAPPAQVAATFTRAGAVRHVAGSGPSLSIRYVDGTRLDLSCVPPDEYAVALWRATGSAEHVANVARHARERGFSLPGNHLRDARGRAVSPTDERAFYRAIGLAYVSPELREGLGEVAAAAAGALPRLVTESDIRGVLHCHSTYSDGSAGIAELAGAARARGWSYLGITDHSESAFYAGGLARDAVLRQHDEIDAVNEMFDDFRVLKGIEADILSDGRVDYDDAMLDRFEYVIASVHSRFGIGQTQMTERVIRALDDPHVTILGHPTGRLLLARAPYAIDLAAVIEKASEVGAAVELNADPHRLDLDWRACRMAKDRGVPVAISPDAHSPHGLDNVRIGVGIARKGWLERRDVLNARGADEVVDMARRRREAGGARPTRAAPDRAAAEGGPGDPHPRDAQDELPF